VAVTAIQARAEERAVAPVSGGVRTLVILTDEELRIAPETKEVIGETESQRGG
jgi:acetate kinase